MFNNHARLLLLHGTNEWATINYKLEHAQAHITLTHMSQVAATTAKALGSIVMLLVQFSVL